MPNTHELLDKVKETLTEILVELRKHVREVANWEMRCRVLELENHLGQYLARVDPKQPNPGVNMPDWSEIRTCCEIIERYKKGDLLKPVRE